MPSSRACHHHTLAKNGIAHVQRCTDCGCISVHLGPFTMRLDDTGFEALHEVLVAATAELQVERVLDRPAGSTQRGLA